MTIKKEALKRPMQEQERLAQQLLESLDGISKTEAERLWLGVAAQRAEEIDRGAAQLVSAEDMDTRVQKLLE